MCVRASYIAKLAGRPGRGSQDPVLFTGPVRYNLDPFGTAGDSELWAALEAVQMRGRVAGLDDHVAEAGCNWSVGERQVRGRRGCVTRISGSVR
jgi:ABC-type multidrug transport system fused ATPase/permease subunit